MRLPRLAFRIGLVPASKPETLGHLQAAAEPDPPEIGARWFGSSIHVGTLLTVLMFASGLITSHISTSNRLAVAEAGLATAVKRADLQNEQINRLRDDKLSRNQYELDLRRQENVNLTLAQNEHGILMLLAQRTPVTR